MDSNFVIKRSNRKTISLSVTKELQVVVRAPERLPKAEIERLVAKHGEWIEKQRLLQKERQSIIESRKLSADKIEALKQEARKIAAERVQYYSEILGVKPSGIKITSAATRWGSCSGKNHLCFPYRIALLPIRLIDSIVVHELVHIRIKNHSKQFYDEVEKYMPDYKNRIKELKAMQKNLGL